MSKRIGEQFNIRRIDAPQAQSEPGYLELLRDLAKELMDCNTEDEICWQIARGAIKKIGLEDCVVYLFNPDTGMLEQRAAYGPKNPIAYDIANPIEIKLGDGVVGHAAETLKTVHVPDTTADARYIIDDEARLSELAVPLVSDNNIIGVIDSENSARNFFTHEHITLLEAIALIAETRFSTTNLLRRIDEKSRWLTRTKREYQAIFNNSPSGVIVCTQDKMITEVNQSCANMLRSDPEALVGKALHEILGDDASSLISCILEEQRRGELVSRAQRISDTVVSCRDGHKIFMNIEVAEVDDIILVDCQDMTEFRKLALRLERAAERDSLTQVLNRASFESQVHGKLDCLSDSRDVRSWYLCVVDVDRFKDLNDQFGHALGDQVLCAVASELEQVCGYGGSVGRLGGDEFGVLIALPRDQEIETALQRVLQAVASRVWVADSSAVRSTLSIGAVKCGSGDLAVADYLLAADEACYQSKAKGRNCFTFIDQIDALVGKRTTELATTMLVRQALEDDRIELHAQPIASLRSRLTSGYEILARIREEDGTLLMPGQFMAAVERSDLAPILDLCVLRKALKWLGENPGFSQVGNFISVNLSGHTLSSHQAVDDMCKLISANTVAATSLLLEVTETVAVQDIQQTNVVMQQLRNVGVRFALDDFGVGVSSLAYLKHLPVDVLKIDGGFIREIHKEPFDQALVAAIQSLAKAQGILTVAEWVECSKSLAVVEKLGVDMVQGYVLGKPVPLTDISDVPTNRHAKLPTSLQVPVHH